mgnify:CR=1 FL=1
MKTYNFSSGCSSTIFCQDKSFVKSLLSKKILYQSEQPRIDQSTHNFNYGFTLSLQIPLGRGTDLCLKAAENQIKGQEFVLARQKLEANLARMKVCAEQFKLGVKLVGEDAVACKNVVIT